MTKLLLAILAVSTLVLTLLLPISVHAQPLEPFGKIEASGGAEREARAPAGARGTVEALGVWPFMPNFGVQGAIHYVGGLGSRVGGNLAPVFAWPGGKAGVFVSYQHRGLRGNDFVHVIPSVAFYLPQFNFNVWYSHPVNGRQTGGHRVEYGINKVQGTMSFFNPSDWAPFLRRDNVELLLGVQGNTFAGPGHNKVGGTGVGPVFGASFLPMPGVAVNLVRATFDDESRYRVASGLEIFFDSKGNTSLKDMRRKYLEPNFDGPQGAGKKNPSSSRGNPCKTAGIKTAC